MPMAMQIAAWIDAGGDGRERSRSGNGGRVAAIRRICAWHASPWWTVRLLQAAARRAYTAKDGAHAGFPARAPIPPAPIGERRYSYIMPSFVGSQVEMIGT